MKPEYLRLVQIASLKTKNAHVVKKTNKKKNTEYVALKNTLGEYAIFHFFVLFPQTIFTV